MKTRVVHCRREAYDVYIGRPGKYGNPFTHIQHSRTKALYVVESRQEAIARYQEWLMQPEQAPLRDEARRDLRGKVLGCWCRPGRGFNGQVLCHGQILAALVDGIRPEEVE